MFSLLFLLSVAETGNHFAFHESPRFLTMLRRLKSGTSMVHSATRAKSQGCDLNNEQAVRLLMAITHIRHLLPDPLCRSFDVNIDRIASSCWVSVRTCSSICCFNSKHFRSALSHRSIVYLSHSAGGSVGRIGNFGIAGTGGGTRRS